jgi:hypothetical protein
VQFFASQCLAKSTKSFRWNSQNFIHFSAQFHPINTLIHSYIILYTIQYQILHISYHCILHHISNPVIYINTITSQYIVYSTIPTEPISLCVSQCQCQSQWFRRESFRQRIVVYITSIHSYFIMAKSSTKSPAGKLLFIISSIQWYIFYS